MKHKQWIIGGLIGSSLIGIPVEFGEIQVSATEVKSRTIFRAEERVLHQKEWSASWSKDQLTLKQTLGALSSKERKQPLTYRVVNQKGEPLQEQVAVVKTVGDESFATVTLDLSQMKNETYLYLEVSYKGHIQKIKHQVQTPSVFESGNLFQLATKGEDLMLINRSRQHYDYESHHFFGEQLHLTLAKGSKIETYQLRRVDAADEVGVIGNGLDEGIDLRFLEEGSYYIYANHQPILLSQALKGEEVWHLVTRNGLKKEISLTMDAGMLVLNVSVVEELPEDVYDLIIDPGHGGTDPGAIGNGTTEAVEVLKVSEYMAKRFEEHGLKVKLTRTDASDPSGNEMCHYLDCPHVEGGRVEQVYATRANYVISNHLNASIDQQSQGSEVYSSIHTSDEWSSNVISAFKTMNRQINDVAVSSFRVSEASYKRGFNQSPMDYYYLIRETGGALTNGFDLTRVNQAYQETPKYGAETLLVEYAFINNASDYQYWAKNWELLGELVVKATVQYLGIPYLSPVIVY